MSIDTTKSDLSTHCWCVFHYLLRTVYSVLSFVRQRNTSCGCRGFAIPSWARLLSSIHPGTSPPSSRDYIHAICWSPPPGSHNIYQLRAYIQTPSGNFGEMFCIPGRDRSPIVDSAQGPLIRSRDHRTSRFYHGNTRLPPLETCRLGPSFYMGNTDLRSWS